MSASQGTVWS